MIQESIPQWIRHPETLSEDSLEQLRGLLAQYPYFQTARLLYLKNLYLLGKTEFKTELQKSALYIADLSVLFYFIEGERLAIEKHTEKEKATDTQATDRTLDLIDQFLSGSSEPLGNELPLPAETAIDYTAVLLEEEKTAPEELAPMKGQELIDRFIENAQAEEKPVAQEETPDNTSSEPEEKKDKPEDEEEEKPETEGEENYFTETLAKIYVKQHRYEKALEIIKKLNLKYPKKNTYFADQIRFLEKLIINAKSK